MLWIFVSILNLRVFDELYLNPSVKNLIFYCMQWLSWQKVNSYKSFFRGSEAQLPQPGLFRIRRFSAWKLLQIYPSILGSHRSQNFRSNLPIFSDMHYCAFVATAAIVWTGKYSYYGLSWLKTIGKGLMTPDNRRQAILAAKDVGSILRKFHILSYAKITVFVLR